MNFSELFIRRPIATSLLMFAIALFAVLSYRSLPAASLRLNTQDIQSALYQGFGPSWVSTIYAPNAQYKVLLELLPQFQEHPDVLSMVYLKSPQGALAPRPRSPSWDVTPAR